MSEPASASGTAVTEPTVPPTTTVVSPPPPPLPGADATQTTQPQTHQHSQRMQYIAGQYGITPEAASHFTHEELVREVQERQLEARDAAIREQVKLKQTPPAPPPEEPDFEIPKELSEELAETNPALLKAVQLIGKQAVKRANERHAKELEAVRGQVQGNSIASRVNAQFNAMPDVFGVNPAKGSDEAERRDAVLSYLIAQEQAGLTPPPPEQSIPALAKKLFGAKAKAPASPPPPPAPAPTSVSRPTHQSPPAAEEDIFTQNVKMWRDAIDEAELAEQRGDPGYNSRP